MCQTNNAKFALTALVICANAHCGKANLSVDRLAELLRCKSRPLKHERAAMEQIREHADPQLLERAKREAQDMVELVVVGKPRNKSSGRREKSIA